MLSVFLSAADKKSTFPMWVISAIFSIVEMFLIGAYRIYVWQAEKEVKSYELGCQRRRLRLMSGEVTNQQESGSDEIMMFEDHAKKVNYIDWCKTLYGGQHSLSYAHMVRLKLFSVFCISPSRLGTGFCHFLRTT